MRVLAAMLLLTLARHAHALLRRRARHDATSRFPVDDLRDPAELREPGKGSGRDPQRTPMPWDGSAGAGFTRGKPWLPLAPDHATRNVERLRQDPGSILSLYRALLALRGREPALHAGAIESVQASGDCLTFDRTCGSSRLRVQINFGTAAVKLPEGQGGHPVIFSSANFSAAASGAALEPPVAGGPDLLPPLVARILRIDAGQGST